MYDLLIYPIYNTFQVLMAQLCNAVGTCFFIQYISKTQLFLDLLPMEVLINDM